MSATLILFHPSHPLRVGLRLAFPVQMSLVLVLFLALGSVVHSSRTPVLCSLGNENFAPASNYRPLPLPVFSVYFQHPCIVALVRKQYLSLLRWQSADCKHSRECGRLFGKTPASVSIITVTHSSFR